MIGTYNIVSKVLKTIRVYVFGWDVTDLRSNHNVVIKYLRKRYDEFTVLIILACISAVFNIAVCLLLGTVGTIISFVDTLMSILSAIILIHNNRGIFP